MVNQKHVVLVYKDFYPPIRGGIEYHIADIVKGLKYRYRFTVLVQNQGLRTKKEQQGNVTIIRTGQFGRFQSAPFAPRLITYFKRLKPDLWHFHLPNPTAIIAYSIAKPKLGKVLVTYHSDIIRQKSLGCLYKPLLLHFLKKKANLILATSPQYVKSSFVLKLFSSKVKIASLGMNPPVFWQAQTVLAKSSAIRKANKSSIILFIGKLRYYKGLDVLLKAMVGLNAKLIIVGHGTKQKELKHMCIDLGIENRVQFTGEVSEKQKWAYLQAADIFCLPSKYRSEAFGIAQIEAQWAGLPIVTTELNTGTSFVTLHKKTGLVVPPSDVKALNIALSNLLSNIELRQKYGEAGRQRAESEFSLAQMLSRLEVHYHNLCSANTYN